MRTQLVCEDKSLSSQTTLVYLNAQLKKHMQTSYHVMRTKNLWGHGYLPCLLSAALCNSNFWKGHHWACQRFLNSSLLSRQSWYRIQSEAGCKVSHFGALTGTLQVRRFCSFMWQKSWYFLVVNVCSWLAVLVHWLQLICRNKGPKLYPMAYIYESWVTIHSGQEVDLS